MNITIKSDSSCNPTIKSLKPGTAFLYGGILYIRTNDVLPLTISDAPEKDRDIAIVLTATNGFNIRYFGPKSKPEKILGEVTIV